MSNTTIEKVLILAPELRPQTEDVKQEVMATPLTVEDSTDYVVTINDTDFTYTSGVSATQISIAAGIVAAINAGSEPVTAIDNLDGTFNLEADVAGDYFSIDTNSKLSSAIIVQPWKGSELVEMLLEDIVFEVKSSRYKYEQERAQRYLMAHLLTKVAEVADSGSAAGGIEREKVGDVEIWRPGDLISLVSASGYNTTKYGEIFLGIRQRYSLRFI